MIHSHRNGGLVDSQIESLLRSDHESLDALLSDVVVFLDSDESARLYRALDLFWARLAMHIRAEHLCLFPAVIGAAGQDSKLADVPGLIESLRHDHDFFMRELARAIRILRESENATTPVRTILEEVKDRLVVHDRIEEARIYKIATAGHMTPDAITELFSAIKAELDNLPPRLSRDTDV